MRTNTTHAHVVALEEAPAGLDRGGAAQFGSGRLWSVDDVAGRLGVSRALVYALSRRGELPTVRIGGRYVRFRAEAIEAWITRQEVRDPYRGR